MIKTVLIANRGEIAVRIIRTCKKLGIKAVAVYSDIDKNSLFVKNADTAYSLQGTTASETYLNIDKILTIAKLIKQKNPHEDLAIHPGYGFLSENTDFAQAVIAEGFIFIGPTPEAILAMGLKSTAKQIMAKAQVNILPGYNGDDQSDEVLYAAADKIGYPVLIKASAGGGGKGMRIVHESKNLLTEVAAARREALKSFANDHIILERYLVDPRHIEVQILFDKFGHGVYLFERDCSLQRRYQKVIEEAPAPSLSIQLRQELGEQALKAGQAVDYIGAGTIEFLLDTNTGRFYFMEMNTRLQVEHPVTELITGLDLVELQIAVASGLKLPFNQNELKYNGHAIEARLYAEDVDNNFLPSTGKISYLNYPESDNLKNGISRIDSGIQVNDEISIHYDPMLAKVIAWGETREKAIDNLIYTLQNVLITGINTNLKFLFACVNHQFFRQGMVSTDFIKKYYTDLIQDKLNDYPTCLLSAAIYRNFCENFKSTKNFAYPDFTNVTTDPWNDIQNFRVNNAKSREYIFNKNDTVVLETTGVGQAFNALVKNDDSTNNYICMALKIHNKHKYYDISFSCNGTQRLIQNRVVEINHCIYVFDFTNCNQRVFSYINDQVYSNGGGSGETVTNIIAAPMPGTILNINVSVGAKVQPGDPLVILEAMKMEHTVYAKQAGEVQAIIFKQGQQVELGAEILVIV